MLRFPAPTIGPPTSRELLVAPEIGVQPVPSGSTIAAVTADAGDRTVSRWQRVMKLVVPIVNELPPEEDHPIAIWIRQCSQSSRIVSLVPRCVFSQSIMNGSELRVCHCQLDLWRAQDACPESENTARSK